MSERLKRDLNKLITYIGFFVLIGYLWLRLDPPSLPVYNCVYMNIQICIIRICVCIHLYMIEYILLSVA